MNRARRTRKEARPEAGGAHGSREGSAPRRELRGGGPWGSVGGRGGRPYRGGGAAELRQSCDRPRAVADRRSAEAAILKYPFENQSPVDASRPKPVGLPQEAEARLRGARQESAVGFGGAGGCAAGRAPNSSEASEGQMQPQSRNSCRSESLPVLAGQHPFEILERPPAFAGFGGGPTVGWRNRHWSPWSLCTIKDTRWPAKNVQRVPRLDAQPSQADKPVITNIGETAGVGSIPTGTTS